MSLNALVDKDLTYVKEDLYTIAQGDYQALGKDATPCTSELNLTVTRSDDTVISLVADEIQDAGGAHGSDWRSGWNYDTETGQLLTFPTWAMGSGKGRWNWYRSRLLCRPTLSLMATRRT